MSHKYHVTNRSGTSGKLHHDNWLDGLMAQQKHSQNYYPELDQL